MIKSKLQPVAPVLDRSATFGQLLSEERAGWFVGREGDLAALDAALDDPSCSLVHLSGQAGVGKTSLLLEFARQCRESSFSVTYVDAAEVNSFGVEDLQRW